MAEQYASFQGQQPNIDVNLFVNAITAGIAQGNAQKNTAGAIFEGVDKGVKNAVSTAQGVQGIRQSSAELAVSEDPNVIAAKKQSIISGASAQQAQATVAQNAAATSKATQATSQEAAVLSSQTARDNAQIVAQDSSALASLVKLGTAGDVQGSLAAINSPGVQQALSRNPVFGQQFVTTLRQQGADPAILDPLQKQYDTLAYQTQTNKAKNYLGAASAKAAAEEVGLAAKFQSNIDTTPEFANYINKNDFDYRQLGIKPSAKLTAQGTPIGYDYTYGDQVIKPNAFSRDEIRDARKQLYAWKANFHSQAGNPPESLRQPVVKPTGSLAPQGLHNLKPPAAPVVVSPTAGTTTAAREPFLEAAIKIGGFSPQIVDSNKKVFRELNGAISSVVNNGTIQAPESRLLIQDTIKNTAKSISGSIYDTSPAVRAVNTQVQMDQYNANLELQFHENDNSFNASSRAFIDSMKVTSPKEFYFMNSGGAVVKQVTDFTNDAIKARNRIIQQQQNKAKSNSLLQELSGAK